MTDRPGKGSLAAAKLRTTAIIVLLYFACKQIPIPWAQRVQLGSGAGLLAFVSGMLGTQNGSNSILSLGLQPLITASIFVQLFVTMFKKEDKDYSQSQVSLATRIAALVVAVPLAVYRALGMQYSDAFPLSFPARIVLTSVILAAGSFAVIWFSDRNTARGIGGQSALILVNMLDSSRVTAAQLIGEIAGSDDVLKRIFILTAMVIGMTFLSLLFESAEVREPVHRSIMNSSREDIDYIAVKCNPAGSMPVMYVMTVFSIPYYILMLINLFVPVGGAIAFWQQAMNMQTYLGLFLFITLLWLLTFAMAFIMVSPADISKTLRKAGDYIIGVPAGRATRQVLRRDVIVTSVLSSAVITLTIGIPIAIRISNHGTSPIYMLPTTIFIISGIFLQIYDELHVLRLMEDYKPFL